MKTDLTLLARVHVLYHLIGGIIQILLSRAKQGVTKLAQNNTSEKVKQEIKG